MRRSQQSALSNPVLIGAVTVLVALVAVFLAYNANQGLPFVPTRVVKVDLANGQQLVVGNDVRENGFRIGLVSALNPVLLKNGQTIAQVTLKLNQANGRVPVDSSATVLPLSALGLKYVDLNFGTSKKDLSDGGTLALSHTSTQVQFDDIFKIFNPPTRTAIQQNLVGFGDTLASRGSSLNDTIASLPSLFYYLSPVAGYLQQRQTQLVPFLNSLNNTVGAIAPVSSTFSSLFTDMATTFAAISNNPNDLEQTIAESPSTLDVSTTSLRLQQPFLTDLTTLGIHLQPASRALEVALPVIDPAIEAGTRTLARTPVLNRGLQQVMRALKNLTLAPGTNIALNGLTNTTQTLNPMVRYLGPFQTVCDSWNYWWTYLSEHISEATSFGFAQRAMFNTANSAQTNNLGQQGATAPVNGGGSDSTVTGGNEYAHGPTYGAAVDNAGNADCETGQRGYPLKLNHLDPQGRNFDTDAHTPGNQGPTFKGRTHVPKGETFSREPTTGPQLPNVPGNN